MATKNNFRSLVAGDILQIQLRNGYYCYGLVLLKLDIAFLDFVSESNDTSNIDWLSLPWIFATDVYHNTLKKRWHKIGHIELAGNNSKYKTVYFFYNTVEPGKFRISTNDVDFCRPAKVDEINGLESHAVWPPECIEDRLFTYFFRDKLLYYYEYKVQQFEKGTLNANYSNYGYDKIQEFIRNGIWPLTSPPSYYFSLETDEEKLAFAQKSFDPQKGWDLSFLSLQDRLKTKIANTQN